MKTLEFKLHPNMSQSQTIGLWLQQLKWVWNRGLELLEEDQQRRWRQKHNRSLPDSLKLKWKNNHFVSCGVQKTKRGYKYCIIRTNRNIEDPKKLFTSGSYYAKRHNQDKPWLQGICTRVMSGIHQSLDKAWKTYIDPSHPGRRPHYKRKQDKLKTLINNNGRTTVKFTHVDKSDNAYVQFPVLGKMSCKGFYKRYPVGLEHGSVQIVKEPSGYYLQVCVDLPEKPLKQSDRLVGIDPGLKSVLTTDKGREVAPPRLYRKQEKRIQRLQRKANRQQEGSTSQKRTRHKIALEQEKIRRSRNGFNHKLSTKIVREYGAVAIEDIQIKNLARRPKPKKRKDGKGYEQNGAKRKSGLNKSFADNALGDLIAKIETKCKAQGREFVRVPAHYTTIDCSRCGTQIKKALSVRTHRCTSCGYVAGRDENAAQNILLKGRELFERIYRAWAWEVMPLKGGDKPSVQVEAGQPAPEDEYSSQQPNFSLKDLRDTIDVQITSQSKTPSNPCKLNVPVYEQLLLIRDLEAQSNPSVREVSCNKRKTKKRTSAPKEAEGYVQLSFLDTSGAIQIEGLGMLQVAVYHGAFGDRWRNSN